MCSSRLPIHFCKAIFSCLRKECLLSQLGAKDSDGDTPLSSMIRTGNVDSECIALLLQQIPSYTKHMLQSRNKKGETPIERAFDLQEWDAVGLLLKECIQNKILPELTGIGAEVPNVKTLLHKAFERKNVEYLQIYLAVCRECNVKPGLLVQTKKGHTPWQYFLMSHKNLTLMQRALDTLVEFGVNINTLYIDTASRASLLHEAYRRNNEVLVNCLVEAGADREVKDARGLKPSDRKRAVDIEVVLAIQPENPLVHSTKSSRKRAKRREMRRKQHENQNEEDVNVPMADNHQNEENVADVNIPMADNHQNEENVNVPMADNHQNEENVADVNVPMADNHQNEENVADVNVPMADNHQNEENVADVNVPMADNHQEPVPKRHDNVEV